jgi:hypothetical protein
VFELVSEQLWTVPIRLTDADRYRFEFGWRYAQGPSLMFVGINPSFGTADKPDRTMISMRGIAAFNGYGSFVIGNPFALRALEPRDLTKSMNASYAIGPGNLDHLQRMAEKADTICLCWGVPRRELYRHVAAVHIMLEKIGKPLMCLGKNDDGSPRHPLYLPSRTRLEPFVG